MAVLGLRFCARAFSSCAKRGPLFIAVRRPLFIAVRGPSFVTIFAPGLLTQFLAFSCPSATQSSPGRKAIKNYPSPHPGRPPRRPGGSSLVVRVSCGG